MTAFTVVTIAADLFDFARLMLPHTNRIARDDERYYFFYETNGGDDFTYTDVGGDELLMAVHTFSTLSEAEAWVRGGFTGNSEFSCVGEGESRE